MQTSFCPRPALAFTWLFFAGVAVGEQKPGEVKGTVPPAKVTSPNGPSDKIKPAAAALNGDIDKPPPADAVFLLIDKLEDALRRAPRFMLLSSEAYQKLLAENRRLKAEVRPNGTMPPSTCKLSGKIEGGVALLQAQFEFDTDQPNMQVLAACGQASVTAASLDGNSVTVRPEINSYVIQVDKPGNHKLALDLMVRLTVRAGSVRLELDLPRAAITNVELELPAGARDVRLASKIPGPPNSVTSNRLVAKLGVVTRLDVSWQDAKAVVGTTPLLSAEGRVLVQISEHGMTTRAELTLASQGGPVKEWRLQVPAKAVFRYADPDRSRIQAEEHTEGLQSAVHVIRLKEPTLEPLKATILVGSGLPRAGTPLPVGPFNLVGAARQAGTILVSSTAADFRTQPRPRGDLERREISAEEQRADPNLIAAFSYRTIAATDVAGPGSGPAQPWIDLQMENIRGLLETRVSHTLRLLRTGTNRLGWRVTTTLDATPIRTGVDHVEMLLPPDYTYDKQRGPRPAELVGHVDFDDNTRLLHFQLEADPLKPFQPFKLSMEGVYQQPAGDTGRLALALPVPKDTRDRGAELIVVAPHELELTLPEAANFNLELVSQDPQRIRWSSDRIPEKVEVSWQRYRPEVAASMLADLTLAPRECHVRQQIRLQFVRDPVTQIGLRLPAVLAKGLAVKEGGRLREADGQFGTLRQIELTGVTGKEHTVVLEYSFPVVDRADGGPLAIPLAAPGGVTGGESKVRVWCDPGHLPLAPGGPWEELNIEEVKGRDRLPALVLQCQRLDAPLALPLGDPPAGSEPVVLVERALIRAVLEESGAQAYHASFLLRQIAGPTLDVELPAPALGLRPRIAVAGKEISWNLAEEGGRIVRLRISPELVRQATVLDVSYRLPIDRAEGGMVQSHLQPPTLRGAPDQMPVRWSIGLPSGWIALAPEGGLGAERTWGRRGKLLGPQLTTTRADLERWLAGPEGPSPSPVADGGAPPAQVLWRNAVEPIIVTHVPERVWFLVCSPAVLLLGLGLSLISRPRTYEPLRHAWLFLATLALFTLGGASLWLLYPTLLNAILYGGQIGVAVLLLYLLFQWALRERYRRQVVFLSSFSRTARKESSIVRPAGSSLLRKRGEPSTVDAPPPGSSLAAAEDLQ